MIQPPNRNRQLTLVALLVTFHLAWDMAWPRGIPIYSHWVIFAGLGFSISQVNLIATWAALAPGRLMVRLPWAMFLGVLMWYALVLGQSYGRPDYGRPISRESAVVLGISILFGVLVNHVPLWIANVGFGWRLMVGEDVPSKINERQFRLSHLLAGMFLLSVALSLGRVVLPAGNTGGLPPSLRQLGTLLPVVAICNLLVSLPCIWGAFAGWRRIPLLAVIWVLYAAVVTWLEVGMLTALAGGGAGGIMIEMSLLNLIQCITVWGTLLLLRAIGFRLVRIRR